MTFELVDVIAFSLLSLIIGFVGGIKVGEWVFREDT